MKFIYLVFFGLLSQLSLGQSKEYNEANDFSLSVVETLFDGNCNSFINHLNDSVLFIQHPGAKPMAVSDSSVLAFLKFACNNTASDSSDYKTFLKHFEKRLFDYDFMIKNEMFVSMFDRSPYYELKKGDYFFVCGPSNNSDQKKYIGTDDLLTFIIRKINGEYKVIVFAD